MVKSVSGSFPLDSTVAVEITYLKNIKVQKLNNSAGFSKGLSLKSRYNLFTYLCDFLWLSDI